MDNEKLKLLSPVDVAARLRVSISTLNKWRLTGVGPRFAKIGSKISYDEAGVDEWLSTRLRMSTSDRGKAA